MTQKLTLRISLRISWNPADFMKSVGFHTDFMKSGGFHTDFMKSGGFHTDFMKSGGFHTDFTMKSGGFHEIREIWRISGEIWWISPRYHLWNPPKIIKASVSAKTLEFDECRVGAMTKDFMKSTRFHPEIWWISPVKSGRFHPDFTCEIHPNYKSKCFSKNFSVWWMQGGGFHPWNPVDFTLKSGGFHPWNLADFTQISPVKSTQNYKSKCFSKNSLVWWMQGGGFHPRNLVDFTLKSGGFQPWNLVDFTQIWPVKSTQNYKSKCFSKNSSVWWMQGGGYDQGFHEIHQISPWNLVDFTCEIQQSSPWFHLWNPPKIIKASVSAKTFQFDECKVGAMTKDFMKSARFHVKSAGFHVKSGGFHVKSKDLLQGIVTLCLKWSSWTENLCHQHQLRTTTINYATVCAVLSLCSCTEPITR